MDARATLRARSPLLGVVAVVSALLILPVAGRADEDQSWLGIYIGPTGRTGDDGSAIRGVPVAGVVAGSPAERAGIRARDLITEVHGQPVDSLVQLRRLMGDTTARQWVRFTVDRGGERLELPVRLGSRPEQTERLVVRKGWIGIRAIDLPGKLREHFGAPVDAGAMIADVKTGSPGFIAGLEIGDVIYEIDGEPIGSAQDLAARIERGGVGNTIEILLARDGVEIEIEATISEEPEPEPEPEGDGSS